MSPSIPAYEKGLITAYHLESGGNEYFGWADRGSKTDSARWKIMKLVYTGNNWITKYPKGDDRFKYSWDLKTTYTYELLREIIALPKENE